ncbi:probable carboxylesterase 18 [Macadamia integrifolia]|uniref:probable carboxylesterase 18 n=1 Tax=Macadamia integrifolia TaxID=60698 RepID=UPI001C4E66EE|nr:probable carboxylesterase 18 [Macadamia integrifolia]
MSKEKSTASQPMLPMEAKDRALSPFCTNGHLTVTQRYHQPSLHDFVDLKAKARDKPINGVKTSDVTVDTTQNLWFHLYTPTDTTPIGGDGTLPVIVYFHGGGFAFFSPNSLFYHDVCHRLARKIPVVFISVNY